MNVDRMHKAVGFRNIVVHIYRHLDWAIVFAIITRHFPDNKNFARELAGDQRLK